MIKHYEAATRQITSRVEQRCSDVAFRRRLYLHADYNHAKDEIATPKEFFDRLTREFRFTLDAAATSSNARCRRFFTQTGDALSRRWKGRVFCNPPFYGPGLGAWVKKAYEEAKTGATVVLLVPARTNTAWWAEHALRATEIRFVEGWLFKMFSRAVLLVFTPKRTRSPRVSTIPAKIAQDTLKAVH